MGKVQIVTDSNAYLAPELLGQAPITVIPHRIKVGSALYEETDDFPSDALFYRVQEAQSGGSRRMPDVQAGDLNGMLDTFQRLGRESEQIVAIHMSSELSPMWQQSRRVADMLKGRYTIRVIDSMSASFGLGLLVAEAARAAREGASLNEIARIVNGAVPHLYVTFFSESLNYLERSAQIGPSQSLLGTMLGIKAMLMMDEGRLVSQEKVQTREEVVEKLYEFVIEFADVKAVGLIQHRYEKHCHDLRSRLAEAMPRTPISMVSYSPSLAAYLGPNTLGVVVYEGTY